MFDTKLSKTQFNLKWQSGLSLYGTVENLGSSQEVGREAGRMSYCRRDDKLSSTIERASQREVVNLFYWQ